MPLGGRGSIRSGTAISAFLTDTSSVRTNTTTTTITRAWNSLSTSGSFRSDTLGNISADHPLNVDLILRVQQSGSSPGRIYVVSTESIVRPISNLIAENTVLKSVVKNL